MSRHAEVSKKTNTSYCPGHPFVNFHNCVNAGNIYIFFRIFESNDYISNKVTVFHSLFLSTCEKRQSVKSVCIGHYVLSPASVQDGDTLFLFSFNIEEPSVCCKNQK